MAAHFAVPGLGLVLEYANLLVPELPLYMGNDFHAAENGLSVSDLSTLGQSQNLVEFNLRAGLYGQLLHVDNVA